MRGCRRPRNLGTIIGVLSAILIGPADFSAAQSTTTLQLEPGYLGVLADETGGQTGGIRLLDVLAGGPAQAAGLRAGDIITSIDGQAANNVDDMARLMSGRPAGDEVTFVVRRGNEVTRADVRLTKRPPPEQRRFGTFGRQAPDAAAQPNYPGSPNPIATPYPATTTPSAVTSQYTGKTTIPHGSPPPSNYAPNTTPNFTELPVPPVPQRSPPGGPIPPIGPPSNNPTSSYAPNGLPPNTPAPDPNAPPPVKPLLGVRAVPVVPELQRSLNLPEPRGALIVEVHPGSPAQLAGLPLEAVIVGVDGRPINSPTELAEYVGSRGFGADVKFSYFRFGQLTERMVRLGVGPSPAPTTSASGPVPTAVAPPSTLPPSTFAPSTLPPTTVPQANAPPSTLPPAVVPSTLTPPLTLPPPTPVPQEEPKPLVIPQEKTPSTSATPSVKPIAPAKTDEPAKTAEPAKTTAPAKIVIPSKSDETEADILRRQIRDLEAKLEALEKAKKP